MGGEKAKHGLVEGRADRVWGRPGVWGRCSGSNLTVRSISMSRKGKKGKEGD